MDLESTFDPSGVVDKTQFSEAVHEKADSRARGPDHFGQGFLTDFGDHGFGNAFLAEMSK